MNSLSVCSVILADHGSLNISTLTLMPFNQFKWKEEEINLQRRSQGATVALVLALLEGTIPVVVVIPLTVIIDAAHRVAIVHLIREAEGRTHSKFTSV